MGRFAYSFLLIAITLQLNRVPSASANGQRYSLLLKELQEIREKLHNHDSQLQDLENQTADLKLKMKDVRNKEDPDIKLYSEYKKQQRTTTPTTDVAFYAYLSNNVSNLSNNKIIVVDHIAINERNGYRATAGVFVSPVSGMYVCHASIAVEPTSKALEVSLVKNSSPLTGFYSANRHYNGIANNMILVELQKGDQVWMQVSSSQNDGIVLKPWFTTFSGFLLYTV